LVIGLSSGGPEPAVGATHTSSAGTRPVDASRSGTVTVVPGDFIDKPWTIARNRLAALGLRPERRTAPSELGSVGRVMSLSVSGLVRRGSVVIVTVGRHTAPSKPATATAVGPGPPGQANKPHPKHPSKPGAPPGHATGK
jgi:hypothetical protein